MSGSATWQDRPRCLPASSGDAALTLTGANISCPTGQDWLRHPGADFEEETVSSCLRMFHPNHPEQPHKPEVPVDSDLSDACRSSLSERDYLLWSS